MGTRFHDQINQDIVILRNRGKTTVFGGKPLFLGGNHCFGSWFLACFGGKVISAIKYPPGLAFYKIFIHILTINYVSGDWIVKLRSGNNGYQVMIPIDLAEKYDMAVRDDVLVWCDGTGIDIRKHTDQSIPEYPENTPVESTIFVKTIQPSGKSPVLTLPRQIVKRMGLEEVEKVSMREEDGYMRIESVATFPDPASVMRAPKSTPESASDGRQAGNPARSVGPFVIKDKPIYNILEKLELEDYLASIAPPRKAGPSS